MAHFAQIDENNVVTQVLVTNDDWSEEETIEWLVNAHGGRWLKTSYNTLRGEHQQGGTPLRKNFAGIGMIYNEEIDGFISVQPFKSFTLDEEKGIWVAPKPLPEDGLMYAWDEDKQDWTELSD